MKTLKEFTEIVLTEATDRSVVVKGFSDLELKVSNIYSQKRLSISDSDEKAYNKNAKDMLNQMAKYQIQQMKIWNKYIKNILNKLFIQDI